MTKPKLKFDRWEKLPGAFAGSTYAEKGSLDVKGLYARVRWEGPSSFGWTLHGPAYLSESGTDFVARGSARTEADAKKAAEKKLREVVASVLAAQGKAAGSGSHVHGLECTDHLGRLTCGKTGWRPL